MAVESIARISNEQANQQAATVNLDDFLQIFLTQLNFQDPLEPVDNREFLAQLAQFSAVEIANRTNQSTEAMLNVSSITQVVNLLGKQVEIANSGNNGSGMIGTVSAISFNNGDPLLTIQTTSNPVVGIRPSDVVLVR